LDTHTDRPDGSGGASPTVVTSLPDHDDLVVDDDMTLDGEATANWTAKNGTAAAGDIPVATDHAAQNGHDADGAAAATSADYDFVPALPADTIGLPRGSQPKPAFSLDSDSTDFDEPSAAVEDDHPMAFSFDRPVSAPVAPAAGDWPAAGAGEPTADGSNPAGPVADPFSLPIDRAAFRPVSAEQTATEAPGTMPAVSAAAFNWEMPDPPPTSPSSPARTFLRSTGSPPTAGPPPPMPAPPMPAPPIRATTTMPTRPPTPAPPRPATPKGSAQRPARQAHLTVARVEPWSVTKFSFVVSLVAFVVLFVAVSVLYESLSALGVFESLQRVVTSVTSSQNSGGVSTAKWFSASKVLGYTALLGAFNIVLMTAMSTIGAVVYNLTSRLVGGVEVTLRETE
jgi:hypothetical protein